MVLLLNDIEMFSFFMGQFQIPTRGHYHTCFGGWAKLAIQGHSLWQEGWCDYWTGFSPRIVETISCHPKVTRRESSTRFPCAPDLPCSNRSRPQIYLELRNLLVMFAFNHMTYEIMVLEIIANVRILDIPEIKNHMTKTD